MTIILAILAAVLCGAVGGFVGFFAVIGIGELTGADNQQGALAMGAVLTGLPVGAVIGAVLGAVLVVRARRKREADIPRGSAKSIGAQGWIALGLVVATVAAGWMWIFQSDDPSILRSGAQPVLLVEIRAPADDPDISDAMSRGTDLRNENIYHGMNGQMQREADGDYTVLKSSHTIAYKTTDRSIELWLGQKRLLVFHLDLPKKPKDQAAFTDWRRVDEIRPNAYGELTEAPEGGHDIFIRTRVVSK